MSSVEVAKSVERTFVLNSPCDFVIYYQHECLSAKPGYWHNRHIPPWYYFTYNFYSAQYRAIIRVQAILLVIDDL